MDGEDLGNFFGGDKAARGDNDATLQAAGGFHAWWGSKGSLHLTVVTPYLRTSYSAPSFLGLNSGLSRRRAALVQTFNLHSQSPDVQKTITIP